MKLIPNTKLTPSSPTRVEARHHWYDAKTGVTQISDPWLNLVSDYEKSTWGWLIPGYHKLKKTREVIPHTPFEQFEHEYEIDGSVSVTFDDGNKSWIVGPWVHTHLLLVTRQQFAEHNTPEMSDYYVQAAAASIRTNGWDALTFAAEFEKTRDMFRNLLSKLESIVRRRPTRQQRMSCKESNAWLESRYGWRTLIYDIIDFVEMVNAWGEERRVFSERVGETFKSYHRDEQFLNAGDFTATIVIEDNTSTSIRGSVTAAMEVPPILIDPFLTGWELVPFSFVIDWFVNVGNALSATQFLLNNREYAASKGFHVTRTREISITDIVPATDRTVAVTQSGIATTKWCKRIPSDVPVLPQPHLKLDMFKFRDILSLINQGMC